MEERIIDDEYGRGVRLRKTKDGYVDVTDELTETPQDDDAEEIAFEFPVMDMDEDDEDLVGLSPEEAAALRKKKEEDEQKRVEAYHRACKEGEELLVSGSYKAAELKFEKALQLDEEATDASVGYWRAKTADFTQPEILIDEYVEAGIETLEYDLGYKATDVIKEKYKDVFEKNYERLAAEEKPLAQAVEEKRLARRQVLAPRRVKTTVVFACVAIVTFAAILLTVFFALKIPTTRDGAYILPTCICAGIAAVLFIVSMVVTNKWINALRIYAANEKTSTTEEGKRLIAIREEMALYAALCNKTALQTEQENE